MFKSPDAADTSGGNAGEIPRKFEIAGGQDLPDNPQDEEKMKHETVIMDLPDVSDIAGQENVVPPPFGELGDVKASSDDEEGNDGSCNQCSSHHSDDDTNDESNRIFTHGVFLNWFIYWCRCCRIL